MSTSHLAPEGEISEAVSNTVRNRVTTQREREAQLGVVHGATTGNTNVQAANDRLISSVECLKVPLSSLKSMIHERHTW